MCLYVFVSVYVYVYVHVYVYVYMHMFPKQSLAVGVLTVLYKGPCSVRRSCCQPESIFHCNAARIDGTLKNPTIFCLGLFAFRLRSSDALRSEL